MAEIPINRILEETRESALLEAAAAICPQCADGRPLNENGDHTPKAGATILLPSGPCVAWPIHQLLQRTAHCWSFADESVPGKPNLRPLWGARQ